MKFSNKLLFILLIGLQSLNAQTPSDTVSYNFKEGFEKNNVLIPWDSLNTNSAKINYSFDTNYSTEGKQSLKIDVDISGDKDWRYRLMMPITERPNLGDSLSFSMDIKMDSLASQNIKFGFILGCDGVFEFPKISKIDQWATIHSNNLARTITTNKHSLMYNIKISDVGRTIKYIGIIITGKGHKKYTFWIDNISISGKQINPSEFKENTRIKWKNYLSRVNDSIKVRKDQRRKMSIPDTTGLNLCPFLTYRFNLLKNNLRSIDTIISSLDSITKARTSFRAKRMDQLDSCFTDYNNNLLVYKSNLKHKGVNLFEFQAMKYYRLQGYNTPNLPHLSSHNIRMTPDEYQSIATLIVPNCTYGKISIETTDFIGKNGSFSKENLDMYIAKIWYQANIHSYQIGKDKHLTQELLLKNDDLVKVDFENKTNYLQIKRNNTGKVEYIDISNPDAVFPKTNSITFRDSTKIQAFTLDSIRHKLLWSIVHIPANTLSGKYTSTVSLKDSLGKVIDTFDVNVTVLPFELDKSKITYSLFYTGRLVENTKIISSKAKSYKQKYLELTDMKKHGVLYPNSYEPVDSIGADLEMRKQIGLATDKYYSIRVSTSEPSRKHFDNIRKMLKCHGFRDSLYVFIGDEYDTIFMDSINFIPSIKKSHEKGAKTFGTGSSFSKGYYKRIGKYLDLMVYAHGPLAQGIDEQVANWHSSGKQISAYACPQVGQEDPEVYRRNFGCLLWKKGFDGSMNWAYQSQIGAFWNDFDGVPKYPYRELTFTYPTTDGIVGTVEWEGYRAAITDVRYISTLLNLRDSLVNAGIDVTDLNNWIDNIDCSSDLYVLREDIIDKILDSKSLLNKNDEEKGHYKYHYLLIIILLLLLFCILKIFKNKIRRKK